MISPSSVLVFLVAGLAIGAIIVRPRGWPEWVWAAAAAVALVAFRLLPARDALTGVARGLDVYLFLTGMMLLAEVARQTGLFDWLAALATRRARGSPRRLFLLVYAVGTIVTVFLSNDATAVVLTPAVAAATRTARVKEPLPYLYVCAFIANAASFVLPISNPANLVVYGARMPPLLTWLPAFALPSLASIAVTFAMLRITQRRALEGTVAADVAVPALSRGARVASMGILVTTAVLLGASSLGVSLGMPTAIAGASTSLITCIVARRPLARVLRAVSWGVLPLVAGLFVLVEAVHQTGVVGTLARSLHDLSGRSPGSAAWAAGGLAAAGCNVLNNLPAGLFAGEIVRDAAVPEQVIRAVLVGIDLGPNLSVTGSLATILWLTSLRRDGITVSALDFLKLGAVVMTPALVLALAAS
ncbi:MAG: arsenic transporter [Labilithrix sp.]|nr:arsenic transporter [Labilithrix sp.]